MLYSREINHHGISLARVLRRYLRIATRRYTVHITAYFGATVFAILAWIAAKGGWGM